MMVISMQTQLICWYGVMGRVKNTRNSHSSNHNFEAGFNLYLTRNRNLSDLIGIPVPYQDVQEN